MQKYSDIIKKTGLSKQEINRMFSEMYEVVKRTSKEKPDPELDKLIDNLIAENERRKRELSRSKIVEQNNFSNVKPSTGVDIQKKYRPQSIPPPTQTINEDVKIKNLFTDTTKSPGRAGYDLTKMSMEKAEQIFTDENIKKAKDATKNFFVKLYNGFIDWLTVDEPETNKKSNKK